MSDNPVRCPTCGNLDECEACRDRHVRERGLTHNEVLTGLENIGYNTDCGACMEIFYTGSTLHVHDCPEKDQPGLEVTYPVCEDPDYTEEEIGVHFTRPAWMGSTAMMVLDSSDQQSDTTIVVRRYKPGRRKLG